MQKINKGVKRNAYKRLRSLGSRLNISFSTCIAVGNKIIGLDKGNKTLMISDEKSDHQQPQVIELENIKSISLKKSYGSIQAGALSKKAMGHFLKYIRMQFEHINNNAPIVLSLFEAGKEKIADLHGLDLRSKKLYLALSKIIGANNKVIIREGT